MEQKEFKILSIDGGGIRGIYPTQYLTLIEQKLKEQGKASNLYQYFDLISGTSTGGIIAIGLGLGMSALDLNKFYLENAKAIFGKKRSRLFRSKYNYKTLEGLLKSTFKSTLNNNADLLLGHSNTRLCIPAYNAYSGRVNVYKTCHDEKLHIDYKIPAYQVAMATSSAPTYFDPYEILYNENTEVKKSKPYNIDGGIFANNPTMIAILEAVALGYNLNEIKVLSFGTCTRIFKEIGGRKKWGIPYWINLKKSRLIDMMMQSQSVAIEHQIKILNEGIGLGGNQLFNYQRIQHEFHSDDVAIELDESNAETLAHLNVLAQEDFQLYGKTSLDIFFNKTVEKFQPIYELNN